MIIQRLNEFLLGLRSAIAIYVEASKNETPSTSPLSACFDRLRELKKLIWTLEQDFEKEDFLVSFPDPEADGKRIRDFLKMVASVLAAPLEQITTSQAKNSDEFASWLLKGNEYERKSRWEYFTRPTRSSEGYLPDEPRTTRLTTLQTCLAEFEAWVTTITDEGDKKQNVIGVPSYVTLDQMAAIVNRSKSSLKKLLKRDSNPFPTPDIRGRGGKPNEWAWETIRPWLEGEFYRNLPEQFPADRFNK